MLLLHWIIVLGALLASSRASSDPYFIVARPNQEESNDNPRNSENFGVERLPRDTGDTKVCQSEECRRTAQQFLRNLNQSVDPCEDFYEYACGGWSQHNPIPATDRIWNQLKKIERRNKKRIREILEEPEKDTDTATVKAAKRFHQSCMDLDAIENLGLKPLEHILEENGGWPMIMEKSEWKSRDVSWMKIHENYQLISRDASLFTVTVDADLDRNVNVIKLKRNDLLKEYIRGINLKKTSHQTFNYTNYMEDVALAFAKSRRSNVSRRQISKDINDIADFEFNMYMLDHRTVFDETLHFTSIDTLQEAYNGSLLSTSRKSEINWRNILPNLFKDVGIRLKESDKILLSNYEFFAGLAGLLEKTSKRTIVNYLHWTFVSSMMPYTNKKMRNMNYQLNKFKFGITKLKPRWEDCISENPLKDAVSYQFLHEYLLENSKEKVLDMVKEIQDQFENQISNADWMNDTSKFQAKEILWNAAKFIDFPDWFNNASAKIEFYKDLRVGPFYFDNILNSNVFSLKKNLAKLRQPIDNTWLVDTFTTNVYRDFIKNSLIFPATSHQLPLFGASRPNAVNYGAIGTIIGHELSKPFQELGITATIRGKVSEMSYNEYFRNRCFHSQLDDYKHKEIEKLDVAGYGIVHVIHRGTIADSVGLRSAFSVYQSKLAAEGITENKLPGLENFSSEQIFFLSFANNWCESLKLVKIYDAHLGYEFGRGRHSVTEGVSNTPGFSEAFQCPAGSPMNREDKCTLWD